MSKLTQKEVFLKSEGDSWFNRNKEALKNKNLNEDPLFREIIAFSTKSNVSIDILEIGCGNGNRLNKFWLIVESTNFIFVFAFSSS